MKQTASKILITTALILLSCVAAELYQRCLIPEEIQYSTWFSRGILTPDESFGYRYKPNFKGYMFHNDNVFMKEIRLNQHGFREAGNKSEHEFEAIIIGGVSMMFSYGLSDRESIHGSMADAFPADLYVQNSAWPGFDLNRNFQVYKRQAGAKDHPDIAIIGITIESDEKFEADLPNNLDYIPDVDLATESFISNLDGIVAYSTGDIARALGPLYYRSYLISSFANICDGFKATAIPRLVNRFKANQEYPVGDSILDDQNQRHGYPNFAAYIQLLNQYFHARGVKMLVVFLPRMNSLNAPDINSLFAASIPPGIAYIDLQKELSHKFTPSDFKANGHYDKRIAHAIGKRIAEESWKLLNPQNPHTGAARATDRPGRVR